MARDAHGFELGIGASRSKSRRCGQGGQGSCRQACMLSEVTEQCHKRENDDRGEGDGALTSPSRAGGRRWRSRARGGEEMSDHLGSVRSKAWPEERLAKPLAR